MTDKQATAPDHFCGLVLCQSGEPGTVNVFEQTKDGGHEAIICATCAGVLKVKDGDTLPKDTNNPLRRKYKVSTTWRVGDPLVKGGYRTGGHRPHPEDPVAA